MSVSFLPSGDTGLTVQFGVEISREINARVVGLGAAISAADIPGVIETVPTYRSLLVHYDPLRTTQGDLIEAIRPLVTTNDSANTSKGRAWKLPVCFDNDFAPDLDFVAERKGLAPDEVIAIMTSVRQFVYMLGFAPGQPYLGDLPDALAIPRRENPVMGVPAGSVVIATGKTTIYPVSNPTGWYILGRTPISLFDINKPNPALLTAGDTVTLERISADEFAAISKQVSAGAYVISPEARA